MPNFLSIIRRKFPRHYTQVIATLAVSLGPFAAGLGKGYSSPALASLQESKTSNFHVSAQEGSWIASLSLLGAVVGCLVGGWLLKVGRKRSLLLVALPFSGSWLLTVFAQRVEMVYSTSFIGGFFSAVTLLATQVYVSEIAHPEIRGCLSAVLKMAGEIGTLSSFTLGAFLDWRQLALFAAGGPILFFIAILFIPETPSFLLYTGREEEASKALAWLRSEDTDVASEIETLRTNISVKYKTLLPTSSSQFPFRPLFITCGLMFFQKFSGVTVFHHYAVPIFKQVFGRSIDAHGAAIVVVLLRLLGSMTSGLLIDTAGRLPLLVLSNLFISGGFFGFGLYNWMEESLPPNYPGFGPSLDWIPLTCVLFFTLFFSIGIGPISWLMVGELFPLEYRGFGGAVSTSFSYACAFAAVKSYVDIRSAVGLYGAFWLYSAISFTGLIFVCCLVPETKGVELEEMHHEECILSGNTQANNQRLNDFSNNGNNATAKKFSSPPDEQREPSVKEKVPNMVSPTHTNRNHAPKVCMNIVNRITFNNTGGRRRSINEDETLNCPGTRVFPPPSYFAFTQGLSSRNESTEPYQRRQGHRFHDHDDQYHFASTYYNDHYNHQQNVRPILTSGYINSQPLPQCRFSYPYPVHRTQYNPSFHHPTYAIDTMSIPVLQIENRPLSYVHYISPQMHSTPSPLPQQLVTMINAGRSREGGTIV